MIKISITDKTKPVIAKPLGSLNKPTNENIKPKSQKMKSTIGIHEKKIPKRAKTNPAVPILLDFCSFITTVV